MDAFLLYVLYTQNLFVVVITIYKLDLMHVLRSVQQLIVRLDIVIVVVVQVSVPMTTAAPERAGTRVMSGAAGVAGAEERQRHGPVPDADGLQPPPVAHAPARAQAVALQLAAAERVQLV